MSHSAKVDLRSLKHNRRFSGALTGVALAFALISAYFFWPSPIKVSGSRLLTEARVALVREQFDLAEQLASRIDHQDPAWPVGQLLAGEAATRAGRIKDALTYYRSIPQDRTQTAVLATFSAAELYRDLGRLSDALTGYLECLENQPDDAATHERLAFLYGVTGRRWESFPHFFYLVVHNKFTLESLALLGDLERPIEQPGYVARCAKAAPDDILVQLAQASEAVSTGRSTDARRLLQAVVKRDHRLVAAQAMLGELLVDSDDATFVSWHVGLPPASDSYPDTWYVRGLRARRQGNLPVAARCFWETVRLAPAHRRGIYQLGQVLVAMGESSGQEFSERSSQLFALTQALDNTLKSKGQSEDSVRKVTELMEVCGRLWEAQSWAQTASQTFPSADWPMEVVTRLQPQLNEQTPATIPSANLALKFDLSHLRDHRGLFVPQNSNVAPIQAAVGKSKIQFEETLDVGIDFVYLNGSDPLKEEVAVSAVTGADGKPDVKTRIRIQNRTRIFEQNGGGVAALDFDGDRWPDLCFVQGSAWKHGSRLPTLANAPPDRLFRNAEGAKYVDVTLQARLHDHGYGQGCTIGDFDNDGFPDLYIANVGRNRLHHNNGDGTFSDVTDLSGIQGDDWTASCVMVDLNADGLPDLFDVTYVTGPNVYEAICNGHACSPKVFEGIPDRLRLNRGDGTFELIPGATPTSNSKGLGVVALDVHDRGRPCLYVANDQVPCHFLRNHPSQDRNNVRLEDEAFACGLAFNEDGLAMASMGIAADDANGDGRVDFFVTNFKDESDILYLQDSPGLFVDATNTAGLRAAGLPYVGWGTQFLDADRNGDMDIVVANGHVDDYRAEGGEYHMRPQFFQNTGSGRFRERFSADVGSFFGRKYLGRGLARLDWNGDGLTDFVVSNIGDRASLVTNQSTDVGHFVNVRLHATATARDAIGTVVEVASGERNWSKQLMAGDGYMASNERVLPFGLGPAATVTKLKVNWPSGNTTTLTDLPTDVTIELVEGSRWGTLWRGAHPTSLIIEQPLQATP